MLFSFISVASLLTSSISAQNGAPVKGPTAQTVPQSKQSPAVLPNQPTTLPRTDYIKQMDTEFRRKDADGDGRITITELEIFERRQLVAQATAKNRSMFVQLDVDKNGALSPTEFSALASSPTPPAAWMPMQRFDLNRDQAITIVEYRTATLVNFDRLDIDKDGVVTDSELRTADSIAATAPKVR